MRLEIVQWLQLLRLVGMGHKNILGIQVEDHPLQERVCEARV